MTFLIECTTPNQRHRWVLRNGEAARFGSSPWVEFCIGDDTELSPEHFHASYSNRLVLSAIDDATVTIDGAAVTTITIGSSAKILAGNCAILFSQVNASEHSSTKAAPESTGPAVLKPQTPVWESKDNIAELVSLSPEAVATISKAATPLVAIDALVAAELDEDAIRLLAGSLTVLPLIRWVSQTLQQHEIPIDQAAKQRVRQWLNEPSEPLRQDIESGIRWDDNSSPWTWVCASIAWTRGIAGPLSQSDLASTPKMIVSAMIAALQLASCQTNTLAFRKDCIVHGFQLLVADQGKGRHLAASSSSN